MLKTATFKTWEQLKQHIRSGAPTLYFSSQTSTVIPYDFLKERLGVSPEEEYFLGDLSQLPGEMKLLDNGNLQIRGAVSWQQAREFLRAKGRNIKTSPTEELALVCAGAATSATGERCFAFGNLRSQIARVKYLDHQAEERELFRDKDLSIEEIGLEEYQKEFMAYASFKNAPYPRLQKQTDLMIGTEGQLGVITEVELETVEDMPVNHLFMLLPRWEEDASPHLEILNKVQAWREEVLLVELIDSNAFSFLPEEERPNQGKDAIFFEVQSEAFEKFYENFVCALEKTAPEDVFELSETRFHSLRASVPRAVFEENSRMGVVKMGTDVQTRIEDFPKLLEIYRSFAAEGIRYNLFGHFGDAHLHFNFMPSPERVKRCQELFEQLYKSARQMQASPFAEHGVGLLKQKYIKEFIGPVQTRVFKELKERMDPRGQFFPQGFMNLR